MVWRGCEPDTVICGVGGFVTEDEDDFFTDVDGEAAEHRVGYGRKRSKRFEHKFVRDRFPRFRDNWTVIPGE